MRNCAKVPFGEPHHPAVQANAPTQARPDTSTPRNTGPSGVPLFSENRHVGRIYRLAGQSVAKMGLQVGFISEFMATGKGFVNPYKAAPSKNDPVSL